MDVGLFLFFIGKWLYRRVIFFRGFCNALFLKLCLLTVVGPLAAAGIIYLGVANAPRSIAPPRSRRRISSTPNAFSNKTIPDSLNLARRTIWVSASDLDLAANYLSRQYAAGGATEDCRSLCPRKNSSGALAASIRRNTSK